VASQSSVSPGQLTPWSTWGEYNNIAFAIQQAINKLQTATLVRIEACTNDGDLSPVGFVDVTPLVNQIDGNGNPTPHVTIYGLPYLRVQGGANAVIIDPEPGDIGIALFASRDISKVKIAKAQANPGSLRSYDFADGLYVGGMLNGIPTQYIRFGSDGITITSPTAITLTAPSIVINGALEQSEGSVSIAQDLTVMGSMVGAGINLQTHLHTSAAPGDPTSEPIP
jgi:hypothetical protein